MARKYGGRRQVAENAQLASGPTAVPPCQCATRLRHAPMVFFCDKFPGGRLAPADPPAPPCGMCYPPQTDAPPRMIALDDLPGHISPALCSGNEEIPMTR